MSVMNSSEAVRMVLDEAAVHIDNVLVIYVEPDQAGKPLSFSRRLTLPESEDVQLPFAVGCAQAGALVVLDLHAVDRAASRLEKAVRALGADVLPPMVIRLRERVDSPMPGIRVLSPGNPRELAGAMRYALRSGQVCVVAENPLGAYEACCVPSDWDELFDGTQQEECCDADEAAAEADHEEPVKEVDASAKPVCPADAEPERIAEKMAEKISEELPEELPEEANAAQSAPWGCRSRPYSRTELERTASLLKLENEALMQLCCRRAAKRAEVVIEADAALGECAYLPPCEGEACLWVGADRISICWHMGGMTADEARTLLRDTVSLLELPMRLILDEGM